MYTFMLVSSDTNEIIVNTIPLEVDVHVCTCIMFIHTCMYTYIVLGIQLMAKKYASMHLCISMRCIDAFIFSANTKDY